MFINNSTERWPLRESKHGPTLVHCVFQQQQQHYSAVINGQQLRKWTASFQLSMATFQRQTSAVVVVAVVVVVGT